MEDWERLGVSGGYGKRKEVAGSGGAEGDERRREGVGRELGGKG